MKIIRFAVFLSIVSSILALGHLVVYSALMRIWGLEGTHTGTVLGYAFVVLGASFLVMSIVTMLRYGRIGAVLYTASALWLGTLYWLFGASVLGAFVVLATSGTSSESAGIFFAKALITLALAASIGGLINARLTRTTRYSVSIKNLPDTWHEKKIVLLSDTHLGNIHGPRFMRRIVRMAQHENPEAVIIAGDYYDGPPAPLTHFAEPLKNLKTPKGIYFANGNHEEFYDSSKKYDDALRSVGVIVLDNERIEIDGLHIVGTNYKDTTTHESTTETLVRAGTQKDAPTILIKHAPTHIKAAHEAGVDLVVSGHTHQGQVWPGPRLAKRIFKQFAYGMHTYGETVAITSSGAGSWGPPQRVGTHGEIVVITLTKK
jgi:hypothetical protein